MAEEKKAGETTIAESGKKLGDNRGLKRLGLQKKKVDVRIKKLLENGVKQNHRSFMLLIGKRGKAQIVNLHWLLARCSKTGQTPSILWCFERELGFSPNHVKQVQKIKKDIKRGLRTANHSDPFEAFVLSNKIRYTRFKDSAKILGQTFDCLIIQNFEAITPNLLARTIETVSGGGLVVFLLETILSLKQLYTLSMNVHKRFRTPSHTLVIPRFNERFTLSLTECSNCLILDDELNVLPITSSATALGKVVDKQPKNNKAEMAERELKDLKSKLSNTRPVGDIINLCLTADQAKCVLIFLEAIAERTLSSTVILTAARGRGKSAALGLAVAGAISLQYANIFVTSPSPENLGTLFEICLKGFDSLGYKEHIHYEIIQSTNPDFNRAIVRINVFKQHRQTIQYIQPQDAIKLSQAELLIIDEAAAIPLPTVKKLMGPYLVFLSSTVNGYEGTGRSLSLKLVDNLRKQSIKSATQKNLTKRQRKRGGAAKSTENARRLREISLDEPIRYSEGDPIELWLNDLLCLNCCSEYSVNSKYQSLTENLNLSFHPDPKTCELYYVNRDSLFSYNKISEYFLQNMMSLYVSSHYKNQPNDLQLMSDAPAHQLFVLLSPQKGGDEDNMTVDKLIPDILCVIQVAFEGNLTRKIIKSGLLMGKRLNGDLIPWIMSQQFQDDDFGKLSGARIVRIATHPHIHSMGYGSKALSLLISYFEGKLVGVDMNEDDEEDVGEEPPQKKRRIHPSGPVQVREDLPVLLTNVSQRRAEKLHWIGTSYGLTLRLFKFWKQSGFEAVYLRQSANEVTGEHSCVMIRPLESNEVLDKVDWIKSFTIDFGRRFQHLLGYSFSDLDIITALSVLNPKPTLLENNRLTFQQKKDEYDNTLDYKGIMEVFSDWDLKRLEVYQKNLIDYNLILDMVPAFCRMFFEGKFEGKLQLNYSQCAVLLGIGFQKKSMERIAKELGIIKQQTIALLNKSIRKIYAFIDSVIKEHIEKTEVMPEMKANLEAAGPVNTNTLFDPMTKLKDELGQLGAKKKRQERLQRIRLEKEKGKRQEIPSSISLEQPAQKVTMPESTVPKAEAPENLRAMDAAMGINPDSKFHWNVKARKAKDKRQKFKTKKKPQSKLLHEYKALRRKQKGKDRKWNSGNVKH